MAQIVEYPPGTEFSDFRGPKPCFKCGKNVFLRFTKLPDGSKGKTLSYENDKMTLHPCGPQVRIATTRTVEQDSMQIQQPRPEPMFESQARPGESTKEISERFAKSAKSELTPKDKAIGEMFDEKRHWFEEEGERHKVFMLKLDMLIAMGSGLTSAINRYVDFKKEEAERQQRYHP